MNARGVEAKSVHTLTISEGRPETGNHGHLISPSPKNEPVLDYAPGSPERTDLKRELERQSNEVVEIPLIIGGKEIRTAETFEVTMPHAHDHVLAHCHAGTEVEAQDAVGAANKAWQEWSAWPWEERATVLLRAAALLEDSWRAKLIAATMLGQSKTSFQGEVDAACELIDFWRYNSHFASKVHAQQPISAPGMWNRIDHRPLEGFIYAISPFNFTAIGGNLTTSAALMGNVVIWKPSTTGVLASYYVMKLLEEAGMPPGVINFIPGKASRISDALLSSPDLAGIHFTGSTETFQHLWKSVADNLASYRSYPRLVGETGGKDFIVAHESADPQAMAVAIVRGGFEYQGQKCSAVSRVYIPDTMWEEVLDRTITMTKELRVGDPADFQNFMGAVIDRKAFDSIKSYIEYAKDSDDAEILIGGGCDDSVGYFIEPTLVVAENPEHKLMCEEVFGPVVTMHKYPASEWRDTLRRVDGTSPYALTGAVFARDRNAVREANAALRHAAGNYYINDKPSGAVVGQQPFGGGRASGTNDKAGSVLNLQRWVSPRTIKETFDPPLDYRYPFMESD